MAQETAVQEVETPEAQAIRVHAIINRIKTTPFDPRAKHVQGSYLFDITDVGIWRLDVNKGEVKVTDGGTDADCIIRTDAAIFLRIQKGEMNLLTASMRGEVDLEGDMALAQKMIALTPRPMGENKGKGGVK